MTGFSFLGWTYPLKWAPPPPAVAVKRFLHMSALVIKQIKGEIKISVSCTDLSLPSWLLSGLYSRGGSDVLHCSLCVTLRLHSSSAAVLLVYCTGNMKNTGSFIDDQYQLEQSSVWVFLSGHVSVTFMLQLTSISWCQTCIEQFVSYTG